MNDKQTNDQATNSDTRRDFLKAVTATAVVGGIGIPETAAGQDKTVPTDSHDLHICRGLNTVPQDGKRPGECDCATAHNHSCAGGNSCEGQGGCGTGDYATQYYVADNNCASNDGWNGTGGCGVPIGNSNTGFICSQLNNAVPTPAENPKNLPAQYVGVSVWAIARARFEEKMVAIPTAFGAPAESCGGYMGNTWDDVKKPFVAKHILPPDLSRAEAGKETCSVNAGPASQQTLFRAVSRRTIIAGAQQPPRTAKHDESLRPAKSRAGYRAEKSPLWLHS